MAKTWPPVSSETYRRVPDVAPAVADPAVGVDGAAAGLGAGCALVAGGALDAGSDRPQPDAPRAHRIARVEPSTVACRMRTSGTGWFEKYGSDRPACGQGAVGSGARTGPPARRRWR